MMIKFIILSVMIIIIAVIAALLVTLFIILCLCRKKIKELLCGEQVSVNDIDQYLVLIISISKLEFSLFVVFVHVASLLVYP